MARLGLLLFENSLKFNILSNYLLDIKVIKQSLRETLTNATKPFRLVSYASTHHLLCMRAW